MLRDPLERESRRLGIFGDHHPIWRLVSDGQSEKLGVERRQARGVGAVDHDVMLATDHPLIMTGDVCTGIPSCRRDETIRATSVDSRFGNRSLKACRRADSIRAYAQIVRLGLGNMGVGSGVPLRQNCQLFNAKSIALARHFDLEAPFLTCHNRAFGLTDAYLSPCLV